MSGFAGEEDANREIGEPRKSDPWRTRGYLPHFDNADVIQHVGFHLADSLPKSALERMDIEFKSLPPEKRDIERRRRMEAWIDAGHGSCILREPKIAEMVQNALLYFDACRYRLFAWVVMPNHVHALFQPIEGWTVGKIVGTWKKFTARKICEHLRVVGSSKLGSVPSGLANLLTRRSRNQGGVVAEDSSLFSMGKSPEPEGFKDR